MAQPWWNRGRHRFETLLDQFAIVHAKLAELARPLPPLPLPDPFVCVLVEAEGPNGRTTLGKSGRVKKLPCKQFELMAMQPLKDIRVTVFADLDRVNVRGIWCGVDLVHAAVGECPTAHFKEWPMGVKMTIDLEAAPS